jgi:hypothetical protein
MNGIRTSRISAVTLLAAVLVAIPGYSVADDAAVPALWQPHQVRFHYGGFTTKYTCDGIRRGLRVLLRAAGARDDVRIEGGCGGESHRPQPSHNLTVAFAVPVAAAGADIPGETFPATWREVRIAANRPSGLDAGDCELVEEFSRQILPLLDARDVEDRTRCVPGHRSPGSPNLRMTLLLPVENNPAE